MLRSADSCEVYRLPIDEQVLVFLEEHRLSIDAFLDGLTEEQARRKLVDSETTLLGLVKHATFVEHVWFEEAFTGESRAVLGIRALHSRVERGDPALQIYPSAVHGNHVGITPSLPSAALYSESISQPKVLAGCRFAINQAEAPR